MKYVCDNCGSDEVQIVMWVNPNTEKVIEAMAAADPCADTHHGCMEPDAFGEDLQITHCDGCRNGNTRVLIFEDGIEAALHAGRRLVRQQLVRDLASAERALAEHDGELREDDDD